MVNYSLLGRKMNSELRLSYRKALAVGVSVFLLFVYVLNRNSCEPAEQTDNSSEIAQLPTIYAVTPTYYRPVQKAELTR